LWQDLPAQPRVARCPCCAGKWPRYAEWVLWNPQCWWGGAQWAAGQRRKSCFATVRLGICELKSSCASQVVAEGALPRVRGESRCPYVILQRDPPSPCCCSCPGCAFAFLPVCTHPSLGHRPHPRMDPLHPAAWLCSLGDTQCSVASRVPPLCCGLCLELAESGVVRAGPWLGTGDTSVLPRSYRGRLPVSGWAEADGRPGAAAPPNPASISPCRSSQGFMHMKLSRTQENKYVLGQHSPPFDSVPEIIHHYASRKLPIKGAEHMSLLYPVAIRTL